MLQSIAYAFLNFKKDCTKEWQGNNRLWLRSLSFQFKMTGKESEKWTIKRTSKPQKDGKFHKTEGWIFFVLWGIRTRPEWQRNNTLWFSYWGFQWKIQQEKKLKMTYKCTSKPQHDLKMCETDQYSVSYNE